MIPVFLVTMLSLVFGLHYYLYVRVVAQLGLPLWVELGTGVLVMSAVGLPAAMLITRFFGRRLGAWSGYLTFSWFGVVLLLIFTTFFSEPVRAVAWLLDYVQLLPIGDDGRVELARVLGFGTLAIGVGLSGYGAVAARDLQTVKQAIHLKRFPSALDGFRIAQLSDLHVGPTIDGEWLKGVVARTNAEEPDLVVITGDLVDGSVADLGEHVRPLAELRARHGVFFVTGNHEYYSGVDDWITFLESLGVRVLRNERVTIGEGEASFELAGIDDYRAKDFGRGHGADLPRALAGRDPEREVVLLAHQPKAAFEAAKHGVGLQLSGHTHGGQIFPWGFFVRIDQTFLRGLERHGDLQIYTSCGTGYWGPPMRVGAPPEISLLSLYRDPSGDVS